ncbi:penicillin acylase family protein [Psychrobacter sp. P11G5]|uniref:penicillin acylase family protein n=1 Tax=Psychrobacter sp. P11G5 TaxID=1699624 RepID=UPI00078D3589|nr:penicillin acylase family protein [Psychrobacter sp. P11G5]AMN68637.1 peptidase S45 [Psychrobacter sp. P11G5]
MSIKVLNQRVCTLTLLTVAVSLGLSGCFGDDDDNSYTPSVTYSADIQRTEFGIPHITAKNYKGLGYGVGYAFAEDNICSLAREIVIANGQSMLYLEDDGNVASDIFYTWYNSQTRRAEFLAAQDPEVIDAVKGYAAGYSRYLRDKGVANLDPDCAGAKWVREISVDDLLALYGKANLRGGLSNFVGPIVAAAPPAQNSIMSSSRMRSIGPEPEVEFDMTTINVLDGGSNAYALGKDVTDTKSGILYGNPHEPWNGVQRFYQFHLTLPGELDVMGAAQQGQPFPNIGFNKDVAWSHTVSTAKRFTLYQLSLVNGDPMKYNYKNSDGSVEQRDIEKVDVTIQLPNNETLVQPIYLSHFGPMLAVDKVNGGLPAWGANNLAFTIRDAASENPRSLNQWLGMNKATSVEDLKDSMQDIVGLGFVNTIATDRNGKALYADISTVPHVTAQKLNTCITNQPYLQALVSFDLPALNGSTADCEWGNDADSPQAGIFGRSNLPFLIRNDYVANSNDSYWLSNPEEPLTGFSPLLRRRLQPFVGPNPVNGVPLLMRTRMAFEQILDRLDNSDGLGGTKFTVDNLQDVVYGNRSYVAELVLDDVLADCNANPIMPLTSGATIDATQACNVLTNWDRRDNLDSKGAHVFREFWRNVNFTETTDAAFNVKFDVNDPLNTPRDLIIDSDTRKALGDSIAFFNGKNIALDAKLADLQYVIDAGMNNAKIPMHGGLGREGIFNVAQGQGLNEDGTYKPISNGPTYMQTVTFDDKGPVVEALLAYSQSADTTRPYHRDQTRRYSNKEWIRLPFSASEISNQAVGNKIKLRE